MATPITPAASSSEAASPSSPPVQKFGAGLNSMETVPVVSKPEPLEVDTRRDRATSMEDVQRAVETLKAAVEKYVPSMNIGFDGELNKMIVRVTDAETNEVIRELPPEEVLDIARFLERNGVDAVGSQSLKGLLLDEYI